MIVDDDRDGCRLSFGDGGTTKQSTVVGGVDDHKKTKVVTSRAASIVCSASARGEGQTEESLQNPPKEQTGLAPPNHCAISSGSTWFDSPRSSTN